MMASRGSKKKIWKEAKRLGMVNEFLDRQSRGETMAQLHAYIGIEKAIRQWLKEGRQEKDEI